MKVHTLQLTIDIIQWVKDENFESLFAMEKKDKQECEDDVRDIEHDLPPLHWKLIILPHV